MRKPITDEDLRVRAEIDGRVAFAAAAFASLAALIALLDRVGAPPRLVALMGPSIALAGLATIGVLLRNMRISRFYAAGRAVPPAYAGLAFCSLSAGLFAPFLPPDPGGPAFSLLAAGFIGGLLAAALVAGPLLRKTGAFSIPDLIAARFPNLAARVGIVTVVAAAGLLVGLAGFEIAVDALRRGANVTASTASLCVAGVMFLILAPGGVAGLVWAAAGAAGILLASLAAPLAILWARGVTPPLTLFGDAAGWSLAVERLTGWSTAFSAEPAGAGTIAAIVIGIGALSPLLAPATTTSDHMAARAGGAFGVFWCAIAALLGMGCMALSTLAIGALADGVAPQAAPLALLTASGDGFISICGGHPATGDAARALCASLPGFGGVLRPQDVSTTGLYLLAILPELHDLGPALTGIGQAGILAAALSLAASGVQAAATALGHDLFYRVRDATAMTSRRLAITRLLILVVVLTIAIGLAPLRLDPRELIGLAVLFSAATVMPLLLLALWPRAEGIDAAASLLAGLASVEAQAIVTGGLGTLDGAGRAAMLACAVATITGIGASLMHRADPASRGGALARVLLRSDVDLPNPDKGA